MNTLKVLWWGFQTCFGTFNILLFEASSETRLLDTYLITFSESVISEIQKLRGSSFFPNFSKLNLDFKNAAKNSDKVFCFWDNCIWMAIVKYSLLWTGYIWSAANVLRRGRKICNINKRDFFEQNFLASDQWIL